MISTLTIKKYLYLLIIFILITALPVEAQTNTKNLVNIYFFHSNDCSHCHEESKFLDLIEKKYNNVNIHRYEIHENKNNEIRINVQKLYNIKTIGVPLTIIGNTPYIGYSDSKSNLIFTKTIEYYSRYGYKDQVGELLQMKNLPTYKIDKTSPTLEEFIKIYGNYKLIGTIYTDNLDISSNALILGIISQFNLIKIISIIIVLLLIFKLKNSSTELFLITIYLITSIILNTTHIISNNIYTLIIISILIIIFITGLLRFIKRKQKKYFYSSFLIVISITSSYLENHFYITYSKIFKEIIELHNITGLNKISYYGNYLFIIIIINILFVLILYNLRNKKQLITDK